MTAQNTHGTGTRPGRKRPKTGPAPRAGKPSPATMRQRQAAHQALADARRLREGRARRVWVVLAPIAVAVLAVTTLVAVKLASGNSANASKDDAAADAAVVAQLVGVPAAAFDTIDATNPYALPRRIDDVLTDGGKPRILYIGAEYCPFCAVERWAVIVALSRFGTWSGLRYAYSAAAPEVYPSTATFTFHGASYTSRWLSFTGIETHTNQRQGSGYALLDPLGGAELAIFQKHDPDNATPFIDLGGKHVIIGATYDPELIAGRTQAQIAATLDKPGDKTGAGILAAANVITASICESTGGQPAAVCTSPGVAAAREVLP